MTDADVVAIVQAQLRACEMDLRGGHADDCSRAKKRDANVIAHPSALKSTLKASVEAAERGELPSQQRKQREREARIERLREVRDGIASRLARALAGGRNLTLLATSGTGRELVGIHEELKALGAEEE